MKQLLPLALLLLFSCKKDQQNRQVLLDLYSTYKNGEIKECSYNGQMVYHCAINAFDAGSVVYNEIGVQIGQCNYFGGNVDAMCSQLENCESIYCVENNIWGYPAVDKYHLGQ